MAASPFFWMYDEGVFPPGIAMPYELLYSRTIAGDGVVRYTDVPITEKSVMIEVLSLLSPFRRIAGYAYALRSDGISDYERSGGVTLPFGKNRVTFASATLPYGLEFFPKWGMKTGVISVYIGDPGPPPNPPDGWRQNLYVPYEMRLNVSPSGASYRSNPQEDILDSAMSGAVEGFMWYNSVFWKIADGTALYKTIGAVSDPGSATGSGNYQNLKSDPISVVL